MLYAFESDSAWYAMAKVKPRDAKTFEAVWAKIFQDWASGITDVMQRTIVVNGDVCGTIGCRRLAGKLTVGFGLGQAYWGRGIASRALELLLEQVSSRPMYAVAASSNTASIRVLTKHGFVIEERRTAPETERCLARDEVSLVLT